VQQASDKIALSTAEAEYIAMSHALCETIPIQNLMKKIHCIFSMPNPMTDFCITVHEDNLSAIAMAELLKFTPHTNTLQSSIIISASEKRHLSTLQEVSRSRIFLPRINLQIFYQTY
jgi:hypothetical protein